MSEPEEYRKIELEAQSMSAQVASDMIRFPKRRWVLRPLHRMFKWVETQCSQALKEDGWR